MEKKQYYSIRKHKKGAVSVLLFTALFAVVGAGDNNEVKAAEKDPVATAIKDVVVDKVKETATDYAKDKLGIVEKEEKPDAEKNILEKVVIVIKIPFITITVVISFNLYLFVATLYTFAI